MGGNPISCDAEACAEDEGCFPELGTGDCLTICDAPDGIVLQADEDVTEFIELGCAVLRGDLEIGGEVDSLAGMTQLRLIEGRLTLSGGLNPEYEMRTDVRGLEGLQRIEGGLKIQGTRALTSLSGLDSLEFIGGDLEVAQNTNLASLQALSTVAFGEGNLVVGIGRNLPTLEGLDGLTSRDDVEIQDVSSLRGLESLRIISGNLTIGPGSSLTTLDGLDQVQFVGGSLTIDGTSSLTSVDALNAAAVKGELILTRNYALANVDGFAGITELERVTIAENPELSSLTFVSLQRVGRQFLFEANGKEGGALSVDFPALEDAGRASETGDGFLFYENLGLSEVNLPALVRVQYVSFYQNGGAFSISAPLWEAANNVNINKNAELKTLGGLPSLNCSALLSIEQNPELPTDEVTQITSRVEAGRAKDPTCGF